MFDIGKKLDNFVKKNNHRSQTAIGLEGAIWLWKKLEEIKPKRIADFGSGFSSWLFKAWAMENNAKSISTDLSSRWLNTTKIEFEEFGYDSKSCFLHDNLPEMTFDFIFIDLGTTKDRIERIDKMLSRAEKGATVIFDDWHFDHYRIPMTKILFEKGFKIIEHKESKDMYGRYMASVVL